MNYIHYHLERKILLRHAQGSQDLETTEMRAQKDATLSTFDLAVQDFLVMKSHIKALELASQQIDAIQYCRAETMKMAEYMPPADRPAARTL